MIGDYWLCCEQCFAHGLTTDRDYVERFLVEHHRHRGVWAVHTQDVRE